MGRKRKVRRRAHGSAWHWQQTDCWYHTVPGTGKSAFAKVPGQETHRPTLTLDAGSLMGSLVGQTEERTRRALDIVDRMQPAVLFIDEVEQALSEALASGVSDSGVSARMFGTLLSWLNDHESDVFVVCTANDVSRLPPEFARCERFDALFFLDLPGPAQREAIWQLYLRQFALDPDQRKPESRQSKPESTESRQSGCGVVPRAGGAGFTSTFESEACV